MPLAPNAAAPRVSAVVLNWNGWRDTIKCLESLLDVSYTNLALVLVDNGSTDESAGKLKEWLNLKGRRGVPSVWRVPDLQQGRPAGPWFSSPPALEIVIERYVFDENQALTLIMNDGNLGYAGGNNLGVSYALANLRPDYVLVLNNDTVVKRNFLEELIGVSQHDRSVGVVGPKVVSLALSGAKSKLDTAGAFLDPVIFSYMIRGRGRVDRARYQLLHEVSSLSGVCLLVRAEVFRRVGPLDTDYFMYWEDADYCLRVRKLGFKIIYNPAAVIFHRPRSTTKSEKSWYFFGRNRFLLVKKHARFAQRLGFLGFFLGVEMPVRMGVLLLYRRNVREVRAYVSGVAAGFRILWGV